MRYTVVEASVIEPLFRQALPRATEDEIAELVTRCAGHPLNDDNTDLLSAFGPRDTPALKLLQIEMLLGCLLGGHRNAWSCGRVSHTYKSLVKRAVARAA